MKHFVLGIFLLTIAVPQFTKANVLPPTETVSYMVQCTNSVSDGGRLEISGTVAVVEGIVSGTLKTALIIDADDVDSPEAEINTFPALHVYGTAKILESPLAQYDQRPARMQFDLNATKPRVVSKFTEISLINNHPKTPSDDDEVSEIIYDGQKFRGICTLTELP